MVEKTTPVRSLIERRKLLKTPPDTTVRRAAQLMAVKRVGAIAVVEGNRLIGIVTERDALFRVLAQGLDPDKTVVSDVMTRAPRTIGPEETYEYAQQLMRSHGFRHLPVVDNEEPIGIVSSRA